MLGFEVEPEPSAFAQASMRVKMLRIVRSNTTVSVRDPRLSSLPNRLGSEP